LVRVPKSLDLTPINASTSFALVVFGVAEHLPQRAGPVFVLRKRRQAQLAQSGFIVLAQSLGQQPKSTHAPLMQLLSVKKQSFQVESSLLMPIP